MILHWLNGRAAPGWMAFSVFLVSFSLYLSYMRRSDRNLTPAPHRGEAFPFRSSPQLRT